MVSVGSSSLSASVEENLNQTPEPFKKNNEMPLVLLECRLFTISFENE